MLWQVKVIDEAGIGHTRICDFEGVELFQRVTNLLFEEADLTGMNTLEYDMEEDMTIQVRAITRKCEPIAEAQCRPIKITETERYAKLKEIIRNKDLLPPDQMDLAVKEGYSLEEIAISAIEEI